MLSTRRNDEWPNHGSYRRLGRGYERRGANRAVDRCNVARAAHGLCHRVYSLRRSKCCSRGQRAPIPMVLCPLRLALAVVPSGRARAARLWIGHGNPARPRRCPMKRCGACHRAYAGMGRRVVVGARFRKVCPTCAAPAVRVIQTLVVPRCNCGGAAALCLSCSARNVEAMRVRTVRACLRAIRGSLATFRRAAPSKGSNYARGIRAGLSRAINALIQRA